MASTTFRKVVDALPLIPNVVRGKGICQVHGACNVGAHGKCVQCVTQGTQQGEQKRHEVRARALSAEERARFLKAEEERCQLVMCLEFAA